MATTRPFAYNTCSIDGSCDTISVTYTLEGEEPVTAAVDKNEDGNYYLDIEGETYTIEKVADEWLVTTEEFCEAIRCTFDYEGETYTYEGFIIGTSNGKNIYGFIEIFSTPGVDVSQGFSVYWDGTKWICEAIVNSSGGTNYNYTDNLIPAFDTWTYGSGPLVSNINTELIYKPCECVRFKFQYNSTHYNLRLNKYGVLSDENSYMFQTNTYSCTVSYDNSLGWVFSFYIDGLLTIYTSNNLISNNWTFYDTGEFEILDLVSDECSTQATLLEDTPCPFGVYTIEEGSIFSAFSVGCVPVSIPGTEQVGDLAIGYPTSGFESTGLQWWNGPDEELGYVICKPIPSNTQPTPVKNTLTLSSTYRGTDVTLINSQTAKQIFGRQQSVLGNTEIISGDKVMFSVLVSLEQPGTLPDSHFIGIGYTTMNYEGNPPFFFGGNPGNDGYSIGYSSNGYIYNNGSLVSPIYATWSNGDIIDIVINTQTYGMSVRVNGGYWDNDPTHDPVNNPNVMGAEIFGGPFYPVLCPGYEGTMTIQNTSTYPVPTGYKFLGDVTASVGFSRTNGFNDNEFINFTNSLLSSNYTNPLDASTALTTNGYWNSYPTSTFPGLFMTVGFNSYYTSEDGITWTEGTETISFGGNSGNATSNNLDAMIFCGSGNILIYNLDEGFYELEYPGIDMMSVTYDSVEDKFVVLTYDDNDGTFNLLIIDKFGNASGTPFIDPSVTGFNPVSVHYDVGFNKFVTYIVNNGDDAILIFEANDPLTYTTYTVEDFQNHNQFVRSWNSNSVDYLDGLTSDYIKPNDITITYNDGDLFTGQLTSVTPSWTFNISGVAVSLAFDIADDKWQLRRISDSEVIAEKGVMDNVFGNYTIVLPSFGITQFEVNSTVYITRIHTGDLEIWYSEEYIIDSSGRNESWSYGTITPETDNGFGVLVGFYKNLIVGNRYLDTYSVSNTFDFTPYQFPHVIWSNTINSFIAVGENGGDGIIYTFNFDPGINEVTTTPNPFSSIAKIEAY